MGRSNSERHIPCTTLFLALIHLQKSSRRQQRIHGEILAADVAIHVLLTAEVCQVSQRHQSPLLDHAAQVGAATGIERGIEPRGYLYRHRALQGFGDVRLGRKIQMQIRRRQTQVDSIPRQYFTHIAAVNDGQRVKAEDAGNQSFGFNVGQAGWELTANSSFPCRSAMRTLALSTSRMVRPRRSRRPRRFAPASRMAILPSGTHQNLSDPLRFSAFPDYLLDR